MWHLSPFGYGIRDPDEIPGVLMEEHQSSPPRLVAASSPLVKWHVEFPGVMGMNSKIWQKRRWVGLDTVMYGQTSRELVMTFNQPPQFYMARMNLI